MAQSSSAARVAIIVAIIGLTGTLGAALLANWDKIFDGDDATTTTLESTTTVTTEPGGDEGTTLTTEGPEVPDTTTTTEQPNEPDPVAFGVRDIVQLNDEPSAIVGGFDSVWVNTDLAVLRVNPVTLESDRIETLVLGNAIAIGGNSVWAAGSNDARVTRVNPATNSSLQIQLQTNPTLFGMAATADAVWVTDLLSPQLHTVDPLTEAAGEPIPLAVRDDVIFSGGTWDAAVGTAEGLWITGGTSGQVFRLDPLGRFANEVVALTDGEIPNRVAVGHGRAWVQLEGSPDLLMIDASDESFEILSLGLDGDIEDVAVSADAVWLLQRRAGGGQVHRLDPTTLEVTNSLAVHPVSDGSSITVLDDSVWVAHRLEMVLTVIDPQT